jgi:hypothetical protein
MWISIRGCKARNRKFSASTEMSFSYKFSTLRKNITFLLQLQLTEYLIWESNFLSIRQYVWQWKLSYLFWLCDILLFESYIPTVGEERKASVKWRLECISAFSLWLCFTMYWMFCFFYGCHQYTYHVWNRIEQHFYLAFWIKKFRLRLQIFQFNADRTTYSAYFEFVILLNNIVRLTQKKYSLDVFTYYLV